MNSLSSEVESKLDCFCKTTNKFSKSLRLQKIRVFSVSKKTGAKRNELPFGYWNVISKSIFYPNNHGGQQSSGGYKEGN